MVSDDLPTSVQRFILERINSVEQINVLIFLRLHSEREWTVAEISQSLRSAEASIRHRLDDLYAMGVLVAAEPERARFVPASEEMKDCITSLLEAYRTRPYRVIELIYTKPADALRAFANAFKVRRDK